MWLEIGAVLALLLVCVCVWLRNHAFPPLPKHVPTQLIKPGDDSHSKLRRKFRAEEVPPALDAIVVGSGMGGLTVAALMAKYGKKSVLVLEQHDVVGGCLHTFEDRGLHYIGQMGSEDSSSKVVLDCISEGHVQWEPMDEGYDEVVLRGNSFMMYAGRDKWRSEMIKRFPGEENAIDRYLELVQEVRPAKNSYYLLKVLPLWLARLLEPYMARRFFKQADRTVHEVLSELTDNEELIGVLGYLYGDYGTNPQKASFAVHAMCSNHYLDGAYYPVGGSLEIARYIIPVIEFGGGSVMVSAKVQQIIIEDGRAVGVIAKCGGSEYEIRAPMVISNAGAIPTLSRLVDEENQQKFQLGKLLSTVKPNCGHVCLFLGFDKSTEEMGFPNRNIWIMPGVHHAAQQEKYLNDMESFNLVFISFPSAKDPLWSKEYPNKATCAVVAEASYEWFSQYEKRWDVKLRNDKRTYSEMKKDFTERLLAVVMQTCPSIHRDNVAYCELGTPLSNNFYLGRIAGESYGLENSPQRFRQDWLRPATPIPDLYFTGQDIVACGVTGALGGGVYCATHVLGMNLETMLKQDIARIRHLQSCDK